MKQLRAVGEIEWQDGAEYTFPDVDAARYLGGGWLEEYVWHRVRDDLPEGDVRMGVHGTWADARRARNELDVAAVHNNRLLVIECKAKRWDRADQQDGTEPLYKLDSLGEDLKSLFGEVALVSARQVTPEMRDRAAHQGVRLVPPEELPNLRARVQAWKATGRFVR